MKEENMKDGLLTPGVIFVTQKDKYIVVDNEHFLSLTDGQIHYSDEIGEVKEVIIPPSEELLENYLKALIAFNNLLIKDAPHVNHEIIEENIQRIQWLKKTMTS
jgi:hypothetical protein